MRNIVGQRPVGFADGIEVGRTSRTGITIEKSRDRIAFTRQCQPTGAPDSLVYIDVRPENGEGGRASRPATFDQQRRRRAPLPAESVDAVVATRSGSTAR